MKTYPAKLLLFGEHTVNAGSQALATPLPLFSGHWEFRPQLRKDDLVKVQQKLPAFAAYLRRLQEKGDLICPVDVAAFEEALQAGLVFESNIPTGYGVGSSGALVAAIAGEYSNNSSAFLQENLLQIKKGLAQMESFFHGTSSGIDPLICLLQKPVLLGGAAGARIVDLPEKKPGLFLMDTGIQREATPFIEYFLEKMKRQDFSRRCENELLPAVENAILAVLSGEREKLFGAMHQIGAFQFHHLKKMIPSSFRSIWREGLDGNLFKLKICGAGGGGFILGMTNDYGKLIDQNPHYDILTL